MFEIIRVGIPIRDCDVTESFKSVLADIKSNQHVRALVTVDYDGDLSQHQDWISAPAGHDLLSEIGFSRYTGQLRPYTVNTIGFLWNRPKFGSQALWGQQIVEDFLKFVYSRCDQDVQRVYVFTPGSPWWYDLFSQYMRHQHTMNIIDCPSSIIVARDTLQTHTGRPVRIRHYVQDFVDGAMPQILPNVINLFGGVDNRYNWRTGRSSLAHFFDSLSAHLRYQDPFWAIRIQREHVLVEQHPWGYARSLESQFGDPRHVYTYAVLLNTDMALDPKKPQPIPPTEPPKQEPPQ